MCIRDRANGQDLSFITVEILDKEGILEPNADNQLTFEVKEMCIRDRCIYILFLFTFFGVI